MSNTIITRRHALAVAAGGAFTLAAGRTVLAQGQPQLVYGDGVGPDWSLGGWAEQQADYAFDGQKVVKVNMKAWNATLFTRSSPVPISQYSTLTLLVHGGDKGRQEVKIRLRLGEQAIGKDLNVRAFKDTWARVDCDIKKFKAKGDSFDTIMLVNNANETLPEFYLNYVILQ